jgi:hypothetical protein
MRKVANTPVTGEPGAINMARAINSIAAAWLLSIGFDLFLHAGLLAQLYLEPSPFLLAPDVAFRRIPLGYLTFLMLTVALYWLLWRLKIQGMSAGFRYGLTVAAVVWGALAIGLYSFSTAALPMLAAWWVGQSLELGLAGAVLGAANDLAPLKRIWMMVVAVVVALVAITVTLQSMGLAPAMRVVG